MPLELPDFKNTHLFWITVCGEIPQADEELVKWLKDEPDKEAAFETSRGKGFLRVMFGGHSGKHVHIDAIAPELATARLKAEKKADLSEVHTSLNRVLGKEIEFNLKGGFKAALTELPDTGMIRSLMFKTKTGNVAVKLDGAAFAIEGAPVQALTWNTDLDDKIAITLESEDIKTSLSEDYLTNAVNIMEQAFNVFVLGKGQNEPK